MGYFILVITQTVVLPIICGAVEPVTTCGDRDPHLTR